MTREVAISEAEERLASLLEAVERDGEEIVLTRDGRPVARLSAVAAPGAGKRSPDIAERMERFRNEMAARNPRLAEVTWDELKEMMRT